MFAIAPWSRIKAYFHYQWCGLFLTCEKKMNQICILYTNITGIFNSLFVPCHWIMILLELLGMLLVLAQTGSFCPLAHGILILISLFTSHIVYSHLHYSSHSNHLAWLFQISILGWLASVSASGHLHIHVKYRPVNAHNLRILVKSHARYTQVITWHTITWVRWSCCRQPHKSGDRTVSEDFDPLYFFSS